MTLNSKLFCKKIHFRCVTGFEFTSGYVFYVFLRFLRTTNELYHGFFGTVTLTTRLDFTCSKLTIETLERLEQDVKCV